MKEKYIGWIFGGILAAGFTGMAVDAARWRHVEGSFEKGHTISVRDYGDRREVRQTSGITSSIYLIDDGKDGKVDRKVEDFHIAVRMGFFHTVRTKAVEPADQTLYDRIVSETEKQNAN